MTDETNKSKADNHTHSKVTERATTTVTSTQQPGGSETVTTTVRTVEYE